MSKVIYSDNTDANGVSYPTIGENIRESAKALKYTDIGHIMIDDKKASIK